MITKADYSIEDLMPDEFMPHISVIEIKIRGTSRHVHEIYDVIMKNISEIKEDIV